MVILYHRPGSRWVFAFLQGLRLNVKSLPSKVDCVTCRAKAGQCVPKPLLVSGMSNLISCHKYFIWREKKDFSNMPSSNSVQTLPVQLCGDGKTALQSPWPNTGRSWASPWASSPCLVWGKVTHRGFLLGGRGRIVGGNCSLCAESLEKKPVYQRVASKPPQRAKSLSPVHCALENRPLVSGRNPGWISFWWVPAADLFLCPLMRWHLLITGSCWQAGLEKAM